MALVRDGYAKMSSGGHWFEPSTMRFFRSRLPKRAYVGPGGVYFVTSEQFVGSDGVAAPRRYSVRVWRGRSIDTVGDFNRMGSDEATREAKLCAWGA